MHLITMIATLKTVRIAQISMTDRITSVLRCVDAGFPSSKREKTKKDGKLFRKNEINAYFCTLE